MHGSLALRPASQAAISDPGNDILLSIASLWELTIKLALGKLTFPLIRRQRSVMRASACFRLHLLIYARASDAAAAA